MPKAVVFLHSIYFRYPLGLLIELASYRFDPPASATHTDVLTAAHHIRVAAGAATIEQNHIADAIEQIGHAKAQSLSSDRSAKNPFRHFK